MMRLYLIYTVNTTVFPIKMATSSYQFPVDQSDSARSNRAPMACGKEKKTSMNEDPLHPLRTLRQQRNLTQLELATALGVSEQTIMRAEQGIAISAHSRRLLCDYFQMNAQQLGLLPPASGLPPITQHPTEDILIATSELAAQESGGQDMDQQRRHFLQQALGIAGMIAIPTTSQTSNPDAVERLLWTLAKPSCIDTATLSNLEAITEHQWKLLYSGVPWPTLLEGVLGHLRIIAQFLGGSPHTPVEQRLWSLASQQAQMAGEIFVDLDNDIQAQGCFKGAIQSAQMANDPVLTAVALARVNIASTDRERLQTTLSQFKSAYHLATQHATPVTRCWIAAREAEVLANLGETDACLEALERAEAIGDQPGDDPYWTQFGLPSLAGYKGVCYVRLRQSASAQSVLLDALTSLPSRQATTLTDLAGSYAQQGEVEEACKRAGQALTLIEQRKSMKTLQRLSNFRRALDPWQDTTYVRELDEQIVLVGRRIA
jgi:transcriptional regulator with XRE-family HTH domain